MKMDFDALNTFDDWAAALGELLDAATASVRSGDIASRIDAQQQLNEFTLESPNAIAAELDDIARKAIDAIFSTTAEEALKSIASRSVELTRHIKVIGGITEQAQKSAKSIRLENATKAIGGVMQTIRDLHELKTVMSASSQDQLLSDEIDKAIKAIQLLVPAVMAVKAQAATSG